MHRLEVCDEILKRGARRLELMGREARRKTRRDIGVGLAISTSLLYTASLLKRVLLFDVEVANARICWRAVCSISKIDTQYLCGDKSEEIWSLKCDDVAIVVQ
jgi:hypothetical protein